MNIKLLTFGDYFPPVLCLEDQCLSYNLLISHTCTRVSKLALQHAGNMI